MTSFDGDMAMLGACEKFFMEMAPIPRLGSRLVCIEVALTFDSKLTDLRSDVEAVRNAIDAIHQSDKCVYFFSFFCFGFVPPPPPLFSSPPPLGLIVPRPVESTFRDAAVLFCFHCLHQPPESPPPPSVSPLSLFFPRRLCSLRRLFEVILAIGNFFNGVKGFSGPCRGFKLEFLDKISSTKDVRGKTTLIHYIVEYLEVRVAGVLPVAWVFVVARCRTRV